MKKTILAIFAVLFAASAFADADDSYLATRRWVRSTLKAAGILKAEGSVATNVYYDVTVTTNVAGVVSSVTNGVSRRLALTSAWANAPVTNAASITLECTIPVYTNAATVAAVRRWLDLFLPRAFAAVPTPTVEIKIPGGWWTDTSQRRHYFNFDPARKYAKLDNVDGLDLEDEPSTEHTCDPDPENNCICKSYGKSKWEYYEEAEAEYPSLTDAQKAQLYEYDVWFDLDNWPSDEKVTKRVRGEEQTTYYVIDDDGLKINLEGILSSDSFDLAVRQLISEINEHISDCREAYMKSKTCSNGAEQHAWVSKTCSGNTWTECSRNSAHKQGTENHGGWVASGDTHVCACTLSSHTASPGEWTVYSSSGGITVYRRYCTVCGLLYDETQTEATCSGDTHIPLGDACGCVCGHYGSDGETASEEKFHKWASTTDGNGTQICTCKCGGYHKCRLWTASAKASFTSYPSSFCSVCAYLPCRNYDADGLVANLTACDESAHVGKDSSGTGNNLIGIGAHAGCGCKCGKLNHASTTSQRFHPRYPGSCKCYGSSGTGDGQWHYSMSSYNGCVNICSYIVPGHSVRHLLNSTGSPVRESVTLATWENHTARGSRCGCNCGEFSAESGLTAEMTSLHKQRDSGLDIWCGCWCKQIKLPHRYASGNCTCYCGEEHTKIPGTVCTAVCHGPCGEWQKTDAESLAKHTPKSGSCGCQCGTVDNNLSSAPIKFHSGSGSKSCFCSCNAYHINPNMLTNTCPNVCGTCWGDINGENQGNTDLHTIDGDAKYCGCKCGYGDCIEGHHHYPSDACKCYAKSATGVSHTQVEDPSHPYLEAVHIASEDEYVQCLCPYCGLAVYTWTDTYRCSHCGETETATMYTTHTCEGNGPESTTEICSCPACGCLSCYYGSGTCSTCNLQCTSSCKTRGSKENEEGKGGESGGIITDPLKL